MKKVPHILKAISVLLILLNTSTSYATTRPASLILDNGKIVSTGTDPSGRSHTFVVIYQAMLYYCLVTETDNRCTKVR